MSEIANALAKAKERTGQTSAPFMVPGAAPVAIPPARAAAAAAAIRKARRTQRFWIILIAITLPATGLLVWSRLRPETAPEDALLKSESSAISPDPASGSSNHSLGSHGQSGAAASAAAQTLTSASSPPTPAPRPDLITRVTSLSVTAVMPGDPPRIVIAGRIIRQGQALDADLTFSNVSDGQIIFTDARGAIYSRRY